MAPELVTGAGPPFVPYSHLLCITSHQARQLLPLAQDYTVQFQATAVGARIQICDFGQFPEIVTFGVSVTHIIQK